MDIRIIQKKAERNLRLAFMQDREFPNDPYTLMYIGESLIYLGRLAEAVDYLRRSVDLFPATATARERAASLLAAARRFHGSGLDVTQF